MTRLAVLMHPLLDPDSDLYWRRILITVEESFPHDIPQTQRNQLEVHAHRLGNSGAIRLQVKPSSLTPSKIALGTVAHDGGVNFAFDQRDEPTCALIRGERDFRNPMTMAISW